MLRAFFAPKSTSNKCSTAYLRRCWLGLPITPSLSALHNYDELTLALHGGATPKLTGKKETTPIRLEEFLVSGQATLR